MALAFVPLEIDQGEDWSCQIVITDQNGNAVNLTRPMQMDLKNLVGQLVLSLHTLSADDELVAEEIPEITFSNDIGMIQLHIAKEVSVNIPSGPYMYDLFAEVDDGDAYAGNQRIRVVAGTASVNQRVTEMT